MVASAGRRDKRPGGMMVLFDYWWAFLIMAAAGLLVLWQLTVAMTTSVALGDVTTTLEALMDGQPVAGLPGGGAATRVLMVAEVIVLVVAGIGVLVLSQHLRARTPGKGQATRSQHRAALSAAAVRKKEARLWPQNAKDVPDDELAFLLGDTAYGFRREPAYVGQETHVNVLAPTGVGKTYRLMTRAALDAPGALVMTSTRPDVLDVIAGPRQDKGRVWVFDLLDLSGWPEAMVWDFVAGCEDSSVARARAGQIVKGGQKKKSGAAGGGDSNAEFFQDNARDVLQCYLHAAALGGFTIPEIVRWAASFESDTTAQKVLRDHPEADAMLAHRLNSLRTGAPETVASTRNTLDQGLSSLALAKISQHFAERKGAESFDPAAFARSTDTLVIIADDNDPTDVTNLAAMLLEEVLQAAKRAGRRSIDGRLSPPLRAVLDEVANIAPIPKFPEMLSDLRAYGIHIVFAIQSGAQARRTWGNEGAQMLIDNAGAVLVLGGIKDAKVLKDFSDLAGQVDVIGLSTQVHNHGVTRGTQTINESERTALRSSEIAQLPPGYAFLFTGHTPAVRLRLPAWTDRPDADKLKTMQQETAAGRAGQHVEPEQDSQSQAQVASIGKDESKAAAASRSSR